MSDFETKQALTNLNKKTPSFFVSEIFAHGDLTTRRNSIKILKTLNKKPKTIKLLIALLDGNIRPTENYDRIF